MELHKLSKVVCIHLDFNLWSARRKLDRNDLKIIDGEVPPDDLASLGSKKICNPEDIADFMNLKKEAERKCAKVGVKFLGGFAVPEDKAADLGAELDAIVAKFYAVKSTFLSKYDNLIKDWVKKHPGWESIISNAALDRNTVDGKIHARWQAFKILEADQTDVTATTLNKGLATAASGLAGQMYAEIAKAAEDLASISLNGRDRVTQKILSPIRTIRDKLEGLAFLDRRVQPLVDTIEHVLDQLPQAGHIDGLALVALQGLVFILSDEGRMQAHGEKVLAGKDVDEAFTLSAPMVAKAVAVVDDDVPVVQQNIMDVPVVVPQVPMPQTVAVPVVGTVVAPVVMQGPIVAQPKATALDLFSF